MPNEFKRLSRKDLYTMAWAEPMTMVAARFEEAFSWVKPVAGQRKTRFRDPLTFAAAYSLMRLPKLLVASP